MDILRKYFYGQLMPHEELQVQEWLAKHGEEPQVRAQLDAIMKEVESEDVALSSEAFADVCRKLGLRVKRSHGLNLKNIARWAMSIAACMILPFLGAVAYKYLVPEEEAQWLEMKVPHGQKSELILADGTCLHLNAGSRITYPSEFIGKERRIFVDGEVFAEVAKDPEKPFIIASGDVDVKVLGTTFNFKAYDNTECVELLLLEGKVQMDIDAQNRTKQLMVHQGEMVQYDRKNGEIDLKDFNPLRYKGFHDDGSIHFFNLRLSDIASDLERLFGVKVVLLDEKLADTRYFAWFSNNETLDQILDGINVDGRMKFRKKDNVIYISKK